jgi:uncharacterized repeat protein (TIGR01451 family)
MRRHGYTWLFWCSVALGILALATTGSARSVYMVVDHETGQFDAYDIGPTGTITYQATYNLAYQTDPGGVCIDEVPKAEATLFVTGEWSASVEVIDANTFTTIGYIPAPGAVELAGIDVDDVNNIIYTMDRDTPRLYAFLWNYGAATLTLLPGFPIDLANCVGAFGIALDELSDRLYVADGTGQMLRAYDTNTWAEVWSFHPSVDPMDVAVDRLRGFVYTSSPDGHCAWGPYGFTDLCRVDPATDTEVTVPLNTNGVLHGGMGLAVDEVFGYVHVTGGCAGDDASIWDFSTVPPTLIQETGYIGDAAGICMGPGVSKLTVAKGDGLADDECVAPGRTLTYVMEYENSGMIPLTGANLTDYLPPEALFVSCADGGLYNTATHQVTWDIGGVAIGEMGSREFVARVDPGAPPGGSMDNFATIVSMETQPYTDNEVTNICDMCAGIDLWLDSLTVNPGDNVLVPVYIEDVTGWGVMGFDMEICWCHLPVGLLTYEYCVPGDVMTGSGWGNPVCGPCGDDCISIAGAGARPLVGEGVLFYLKFGVSTNAKPCMCCDLRFTHINLYDPEDPLDVCWQDGLICVEWCDVDGTVNYWKCCYDDCDEPYFIRQLGGAYMHLTDCLGTHIASQYTDADGYYNFKCLDPLGDVNGCYCVGIDYCPVLPCITSMDAALVLQHVVCLEDLDACPFPWAGGIVYPQQVAADVNCSGRITSLDASYILQYAVGLINLFPCPDMWRFYAIPGNCVYQCPGTVDWIGVMYGDVNGCPECPPSGLLAAAPSQASVKLGVATAYDDRVEIPVKAKNSQDVMAVDLVIHYDAADFSVVSVEEAGLADGFLLVYNPASGEIRIAMAGMSKFSGNGQIAKLTLEKNGPIATTQGKVSIAEAYFNDVAVRVEGSAVERKVAFGLGPIAPNPFVEGTSVKFSMARSAAVTLSIYNVHGQLVQTLVDGVIPAGQQQVVWDGSDMAGHKAARGVYFCRMATEGFTATTKIISME